MRILYLTQWFEPEPNIVKGIAFVQALQGAGHSVTVVTGFPNYPTGRLYPGYRLRWIAHESIGGVRIVRLPLYPSHDRSAFRRSLNYISFFFAALIYCLSHAGRYDIAYVYHPPITVGLAAALAGWFRRLRFVLDVQDLWPDTVAVTGMAGARGLARPLGAACGLVYRRSTAIIVQSEGMRRALIERGVAPAKLSTIRNWSTAEFAWKDWSDPPDGRRPQFTVVYGGNFGRAQRLETVIDAMRILSARRQDIELRLYGDGVDRETLREMAQGVAGIRVEGPVPQAEILRIFAQADALLLHLRSEPLFSITIPSKTQTYLAVGRPIVAGIGGEAAELLSRSGAAIVVPPCEAEALADAICRLADSSRDQRERMARAGQRFYNQHLSFDRAMSQTLKQIDMVARASATAKGSL